MTRWLAIIVTFLLAAALSAAERPFTAQDARPTFARFVAMAGTWTAHSTKGWTEKSTYEVAAKGSVVLTRSFFEGEPNDGMITAVYLDGDRLMLTHYCEAGNQPTLVAATIDDDEHRVVFQFLTGTNLEKRPGHMHSVIFRFADAAHYWSRWSFYSKGKEQWFEDIENVRVR